MNAAFIDGAQSFARGLGFALDRGSTKKIAKAEEVAECPAAAINPRLSLNGFYDVCQNVTNYLRCHAARMRGALAPKVIGIGNL